MMQAPIRDRLVAVFLLHVFICMIDARSIVEDARKGELDPKEANRLRNMYASSLDLAVKGMFEANAMNAMNQLAMSHSQSSDNSTTARAPATGTMVRIRPYLIIGDHGTPSPSLNETKTSNGKSEDDEIAEHLIKSGHHDTHKHNDARQSGFWPGMRPSFPGGLGSPGYPNLMGGLPQIHPPSFPSFQMFPGGGGQSHRPPKTSVIGNSGGAMALTNDNVVVVNVLSSNF